MVSNGHQMTFVLDFLLNSLIQLDSCFGYINLTKPIKYLSEKRVKRLLLKKFLHCAQIELTLVGDELSFKKLTM